MAQEAGNYGQAMAQSAPQQGQDSQNVSQLRGALQQSSQSRSPQQSQEEQQGQGGMSMESEQVDSETRLARLRADDIRQWCEAFEKHELVDIIVSISDSNTQFQSFLGHALVTDIKWCKIRVTFPNDLFDNDGNFYNYTPTKETLFDTFSHYGAMNKIEIIWHPGNNENGGMPYALITFRRYTDAQAAVSQGFHELVLINNNNDNNNSNSNDNDNDNDDNNNNGETKMVQVSCCYAFENDDSGDNNNNNSNSNNNNVQTQDTDMNTNSNANANANNSGANNNNNSGMQQMSSYANTNTNNNQQTAASGAQDGGPLIQRRLFVSSLSYNTQNDTLRSTFSQYGELDDCTIIYDKFTGKSKGYGFVIFKTIAGAQNALKQPEKYIDGRKTRCWLAAEGRNNNNQQNRF